MSGGLGSALLGAAVIVGLLALGLLVSFRDSAKPVAVLTALGGVAILGIVVLATAKIGELTHELGLYSSMSGGSVQMGGWIAALGGIGVIVGALVAGFGPS